MVNIRACQCKEKVFVTKNGSPSSLFSYNPQADQWTSHPLQFNFGDLAFDAKRIWMIPDDELLYVGLDNMDTVLQFNTITHQEMRCSLFNNQGTFDASTYDFLQLIPEYLNETCEVFQALRRVFHIQGNVCRDRLCSFFVCFVKNEVFALPYFPD